MEKIAKAPAKRLEEVVTPAELARFRSLTDPSDASLVIGAFLGTFGHIGHQIDRLIGELRGCRNFETLFASLERGKHRKNLEQRCAEVRQPPAAHNVSFGPAFSTRMKHFDEVLRPIRNQFAHSMSEVRGGEMFLGSIANVWNVVGEEVRPSHLPPTQIPLAQMVSHTLWLSDFLHDCDTMAAQISSADRAEPVVLDLARARSAMP